MSDTLVPLEQPTKMSPEQYLKERIDDQIRWYDKKSSNSKKGYIGLRFVEIGSAAAIPFLAGFDQYPHALFAVGILGIVVSICAATTSLLQLQEHWIEYRTTAESLKKEKYLYVTQTEPYHRDDSFALLVQRTETLVSKENTNWAQYMMKPGKEENRG
jgi:hypothetical protein